jgi:hypothetical protein
MYSFLSSEFAPVVNNDKGQENFIECIWESCVSILSFPYDLTASIRCLLKMSDIYIKVKAGVKAICVLIQATAGATAWHYTVCY